MKMRYVLILLAASCPAVFAQSPQAVEGSTLSFSAGAEFSSINPDFGCQSDSPFACSTQLRGPAVVVDATLGPRLGAEGEIRWLHWDGAGQHQTDYLAGPRIRLARIAGTDVWGKMLFGDGSLNIPYGGGAITGNYFVYAPGATVTHGLTRRVSVRVDYEYQKWPGFAGPPGVSPDGTVTLHNHGLSPNGFSAGLMYRFFSR